MDISIACSVDPRDRDSGSEPVVATTRRRAHREHHKRQPRLGQLQFGRVNRSTPSSARSALGGCQLTRAFKSRGDRLQRVTRLDLRVPPLDRRTAPMPCRRRRARPARSAFSIVEPRAVDRLERQLRTGTAPRMRCRARPPP